MPANRQPIISVRDLTAQYGDRAVLEHVSFEVRRGEIFVILGGSGCGKSTLMKCLIGLYQPAAGSVFIDGENFSAADADTHARLLRKIGVMYQSGALFGSMTVQENVRLPLDEYTALPVAAKRAVVASKLALVGLRDASFKLPAELSGGMIKRAAIARALALNPAIVFLDEPSAGLDPVTSADLDQTIIGLSRDLGVTFVIVTHELASIYTLADRCIMLDAATKGIIASGRPADLRDRPPNDLVKSFFHRQPLTTQPGLRQPS
ncbi:MAG: ATP-binding cassette domain-containing protein [Verrucomicrobiales bacterium]|jgi:phospholipid/cholesterol/gamma-HCH transport system ATP-binding protein|nr:ATP-binding cassette domain-containing protein [Verrucomicrobiales bacterium]